MNLMKWIVVGFAAVVVMIAGRAEGFDQSHQAWTGVLEKHVKGREFDYVGLVGNKAAVESYLDGLAAVSKSEFSKWSQVDQLAFLINLYNAATVKLILDHHPVKSIRDIGGAKGPWKMPVVRVFGGKVTLDAVEHEMIRKNYAEPRIHFAVNCASVGCPPLRNEAYRGKVLFKQLEDQTRKFVGDRSTNRVEGNVLRLSALFDWFEADFAKSKGSIEKFVAPYFPESDRARIIGGGLKKKFADYDWSLNGR